MTADRSAPLILVVEDEAALRRDIVEELQDAGYRTLAAADGRAAQALLAEATPDLVLCDITMPRLDGFGLMAALRDKRPDLAAVPFVFLTAMSEPQDVIQGKLQGADDYLVKPVDYDLLLATVAARLRQIARIRGQTDPEIDRLRHALAGLSEGAPRQVLDLIALGIVLLDSAGRVQHANRAAREMAGQAVFLAFRHGTVRATDPLCDTALQRAIAETRAARDRDRVTGVLLQGDGPSISALVCALAADPARPGPQPAVALFLSPPQTDKTVSQPLLIELFGLTPTEARVAASLSSGARPADVAETLGVSQTTIAFHMRNLFRKTGTNRQSDLVALILAGPMAVETS
ncbi:MAG: response regulator [Rhodobacteraceae bacterium]|nr:MAG: response regulator [Paracoccaceae bacterium]